MAIGDLRLLDADGRLVAAFTGVRFRRAPRTAFAAPPAGDPEWLLVPRWEPAPLADAGAAVGSPGRWLVIGAPDGSVGRWRSACATTLGAAELLAVGRALTRRRSPCALDAALAAPLAGVVVGRAACRRRRRLTRSSSPPSSTAWSAPASARRSPC